MTIANAYANLATKGRLKQKELLHAVNMCREVYNESRQTTYDFPSPLYQEEYLSIDLHKNILGDAGKINIILGYDAGTIYIAFSGTSDGEFWHYNSDSEIVPTKPNGSIFYVHQGFLELSIEVLSKVEDILLLLETKEKKVILCGHSAGGAAANLVALELVGKGVLTQKQTTVVDYGCPRFWAAENELPYPVYRISYRNYYDIVPDIPFRFLTLFRKFKDTETPTLWLEDEGYVNPPAFSTRLFMLLVKGYSRAFTSHAVDTYHKRVHKIESHS